MGYMADYDMDRMSDPFTEWDECDEYGRDPVDCNRCGETWLHWEEKEGKWRLFDAKGAPHICKPVNNFDVIKEVK